MGTGGNQKSNKAKKLESSSSFVISNRRIAFLDKSTKHVGFKNMIAENEVKEKEVKENESVKNVINSTPIEIKTDMLEIVNKKCGCEGLNCKDENYLLHPSVYIHGLSSSKITPNLIASQRPSTKLIKHFQIIKLFKL